MLKILQKQTFLIAVALLSLCLSFDIFLVERDSFLLISLYDYHMESIDDLPDLPHITSRKQFYASNDTIIVKLPSELAVGQPMFQIASLNVGSKNEKSKWPVNQFMDGISPHNYENITSGSSNVLPMRNNFSMSYSHNNVRPLLPTPGISTSKTNEHFNQQLPSPSFQEFRPQKGNNWTRKRGSNSRFRERSRNRTFRGSARNRDFRWTLEPSQQRNNFEAKFPPNVPEYNTADSTSSQISFQDRKYFDSYPIYNERQRRF